MDERGQTQFDFAIGISIFLLVVIAVLLFLPSVFASYDTPVSPAQQEDAKRVGDVLVADHTAAGSERTLALDGPDGLAAALSDTNFTQIRDDAGVASYRNVNVTVVDGSRSSAVVSHDGSSVVSGERFDEQPAATAVRVVRFSDSNVCSPLCRIVVRVW